MINAELQKKLDIQKWLESETKHKDMCGTYGYCAFCKIYEVAPCANAFLRMEAQEEAYIEVVPVEDATSSLGKKFDYEDVMAKKAKRKSLSFAEKYALANDSLKQRYAVLQSALTTVEKGAPKVKNRISKQCETYRRNGHIIAKVTIIGSSLRLNFALDCDAPEFNDGRTPHVNEGHKKVYACVPFQFKVNSNLALKRALNLIKKVK